MDSKKTIDYLPEDPPIPGVKFALISIVGPQMNQKCDVWGLKIRGYASDLEKAKQMVKRLMNINKEFDIYIVEVGKFFPLAVDPLEVESVEYQNQQLNDLMKSYLENREQAKDEFYTRKTEMMNQAIKEGQKNREKTSLDREEHPVAVLKKMRDLEDRIKSLEEQLVDAKDGLQTTQDKYSTFTSEQKEQAEQHLLEAIKNSEEIKSNNLEKSAEEIKKEIMSELSSTSDEKGKEKEVVNPDILLLQDLQSKLTLLDSQYKNSEINLTVYNKEREQLTKSLQKLSSNTVNNFIKSNWSGESKYDQYFG
jgi:DNA repair exonuclease SbcCD ATPase subunit